MGVKVVPGVILGDRLVGGICAFLQRAVLVLRVVVLLVVRHDEMGQQLTAACLWGGRGDALSKRLEVGYKNTSQVGPALSWRLRELGLPGKAIAACTR